MYSGTFQYFALMAIVKNGNFLTEICIKLRFVVFLKTPGGKVNRKLIQLDFEVA